MSVLHVTQIQTHLEREYSDKIDLSDLKGHKNTVNFFLTRALSAYALQYHAECLPQIAANSITDGSNDNGLDAVLYERKSKTLFIVQSKWMADGKGEPDNGDVKKFIFGIKDLFNSRFDRFNSKISRLMADISEAIRDPNTKYQIILTYTGIHELSTHSKRDFDDLLREFNDASEIVSFSLFNQRRIHLSLVTSAQAGHPINLKIGLTSWGKIAEPYNAFYGQVSGAEIYSWWTEFRTRLFEKNIRGVLGDTQVNQEITSTLDTRPEQFWFFNNGITMICDDVQKNMVNGTSTDFGQFTCTNVSIVNGAQTVSTIGRFGEREIGPLNKTYVPLRIISLNGTEDYFDQQITKANNTQNRVESRDFVSFDPEQTRIKDELLLDGIDYKVSRGSVEDSTLSSIDFLESITAVACASKKISIVVQLKREISKLWENLNSAPYKQLFNPQVTGRYVYNCVQVQRLIDRVIREKEAELTDGREQSVIIHGNRLISLLIFGSLDTVKYSTQQYNFDNGALISRMREMVNEKFNTLLTTVDKEFENPIIPTLFKNRTKCEHIYNLINQNPKAT